MKNKEKNKVSVFYIIVLAVLATLGTVAQIGAGQAQSGSDTVGLVLAWVIELVGLVVLLVLKKKSGGNTQQ